MKSFIASLGALSLCIATASADVLLNKTTYSTAGTYTYTTPGDTQRVIVKAWGAGGGSGVHGAGGGGGGMVIAAYSVSGGQTISVQVASGGSGFCTGGNPGGGSASGLGGAGGGGVTIVSTPAGQVFAGGGGGGGNTGGTAFGGGGGGGGPNGQNGANAAAGGGGTTTAGGYGGYGTLAYGSSGSYLQGGNSNVDNEYIGGGGGGGYYGGGGGGTGAGDYAYWSTGGGGGGGGSSLATGSPLSVSYAGGQVMSPGGVSDPDYPGNNVGFGGDSATDYSDGHTGGVVILAYKLAGPPILTSSVADQNLGQNAPVWYTITAIYDPTSFSASGLPPGLSVNSSSGVISGYVNTPGTYVSTITASNSYGSASANITWRITAAVVTANLIISPGTIQQGQSVSIYRDGSTNFGLSHTEGTIWFPGSGSHVVGVLPFGGPYTFTPTAGPGTYWYQYKVLDIHFNFAEIWVPFEVGPQTHTLPYATSYENYIPGNLHPQEGWVVQEGTGTVVTDGSAQHGSKHLRVGPEGVPGMIRKYFSQTHNWAFVDVHVKPLAAANVLESSIMDYGASKLGFRAQSGMGEIWYFDGNGSGSGTWRDSGARYAINGANQATQWMRLTLRHDYATFKYDLFINGNLSIYDAGFSSNLVSSFTDLRWSGRSGVAHYFDNFGATLTNPLFSDNDHDGLPDSWESSYGLNTNANDRNGNLDGDGYTNIQEYINGWIPNNPNSPDVVPPSVPGGLSPSGLDAYAFTLNWSASSDNVGVTGYEVRRDSTSLGVATGTNRSITGLTPGVTYAMSVRARDAIGNWSNWSSPLNVTATDTSAPSVPTGLAASGVSYTSFTLSWPVAPDNVGTTAYEVRQNGALIATVGGTSLAVSGLVPSTSYSMTVRARDAAGNWSGWSASASVTTLADTVAPSVPGSLQSTAQTMSSISLSWAVSTDNVGVSGYKIFRGGVQVATTAATSYTDSGLTDGTTYSYTVSAYDATGNNSVAAGPLAVSTLLNPQGDADNDGMKNGWEQLYGLDPRNANDTRLDPDADGIVNIAEYYLGLNPTFAEPGRSTRGTTLPTQWATLVAGDSSRASVAVGATSGQLSVDKNGAATYSLPIWVTPGTAGMEPKLSLNYSSQAGAGVAGFGWSLSGVSSITRGPQTLAIEGAGYRAGVHFDRNDRFYLDGQRLMCVSGTYGYSASEYRTEIESFSRVVAYGSAGEGPEWFKVWTKAGLIIEYGRTAASAFRPSGLGATMTWFVSKISDTAGNAMTFDYEEDEASGEHRLSRINYTEHASPAVAAYASVRLEYENRPDATFGYVAGARINSTKRLKHIKSCYGEAAVRTYTLAYETAGPASRSLLSSITETGSDGKSLPALTFDYSEASPGWEYKAAWHPPTQMMRPAQGNETGPHPFGTGFMDLNGDGRPDMVQHYYSTSLGTTESHAWLNTGDGWALAEGASGADYRLPHPLGYSNQYDTGSRFADLNSDGLPDYLWSHKNGGTNGTVSAGARFNTGNGWTEAAAYTPPFILTHDNEYAKGAHLLDLNGDGRVDLIANDQGNVRLNTGTGWAPAPQWSAPVDLTKGVAFVDLNGDGLPDLVKRWYGDGHFQEGIWFNSGNGWVPCPAADLVKYLPTILNTSNPTFGHNAPRGTEYVDLNGDGLQDYVAYNDGPDEHALPRQAWLNTGRGFVRAPAAYDPPLLVPLRHIHESRGVAFIDMNCDGLADLVQAFDGGPRRVFFNTGSGWGPETTGSATLPLNVYALNWRNQNHTDLIDFNGDGAIDQLGYWEHNNPKAYKNTFNANQHRLVSVTTGLSVTATITYRPLTDPSVYTKGGAFTATDGEPVVNVVGPMYVVSQISNDSGVAGQPLRTGYHYGEMRSHRLRGSLGFHWMKTYDIDTDVFTITYFNQNYPFIGQVSGSITRAITNLNPVAEVTLSESTTLFEQKLFNGGLTRLPYAAISTVETHDLNGWFTGASETSINELDDYGNVKSITVESLDDNGGATGYAKTTASTYDNTITAASESGGHWHLGRLRRSTVTAVSPDYPGPQVRTSAFTYRSGDGLLETETVEPDDTRGANDNPQKVTTTYGYDAFGNKNSVSLSGVGVATRTTTTEYDTRGRFPSYSTNALGHREDYAYNQEFGLLSSQTGPNGLTTTWGYDGLGRKTSEVRPDGTRTDIHYVWSSSSAPGGSAFHVLTTADGAAPTVQFSDYLGRAIYAFTINGGTLYASSNAARIVGTATRYDRFSRPHRKSLPFYYGNGMLLGSWTTQFDQLGRPTEMYTADEGIGSTLLIPLDSVDFVGNAYVDTLFNYYGLITDVTVRRVRSGENRLITSRSIKNTQGQLVESIQNLEVGEGSREYGKTKYVYDAVGQLTHTQVYRENGTYVDTSFVYDTRGRKISMTDPDMGVWSYRYNVFGELIFQRDAKSQETTLGYDVLGRMTSRTEAEGTTTWEYDTSPRGAHFWQGKLHRVTSPPGNTGIFSASVIDEQLYDALGRPRTTRRRIDNKWYATTQEYDAYSRPSIVHYPSGSADTAAGAQVGYAVRNVYNAFGFLQEVRQHSAAIGLLGDTQENYLYWQADSYDVSGKLNGFSLGNGISQDIIHSQHTGRVQAIYAGFLNRSFGADMFFAAAYNYLHDSLGNLVWRSGENYEDRYEYDRLNRLTKHTRNPVNSTNLAVRQFEYNAIGNITKKPVVSSDPSEYVYSGPRPHAVTAISSHGTFEYDGNGNMVSDSTGRSFTWTSYNQLKRVSKGSLYGEFAFDASRQRVVHKNHNGTTTYVGALFEKTVRGIGTNAVTENKFYIYTPAGRTAMRSELPNQGRVDTRFFHTDALGSVVAVTNETAGVVQRFSYDPWGVQTVTHNTNTNSAQVTRGYTDHEMMNDLGLIHMNGRVFDPLIGRFISADPFVDSATSAQSYNRYSYCNNDPINHTDPSGYFKLKDAFKWGLGDPVTGALTYLHTRPWLADPSYYAFPKQYAQYAPQIAGIAVSAIVTYFTGNPVLGGAAGGFVSGYAGSLLNGGSIGDAFREGAIGAGVGAVAGAISFGIGEVFGPYGQHGLAGEIGRGAAHGVVGGAIAEAQGGDFRHGFYGSFAGSFLGGAFRINGNGAGVYAANIAVSAVVGGTASMLGGGKFANGALTAAFQYMANGWFHDLGSNISRGAKSSGWGWAFYDEIFLPAALGAQEGVAGFTHAITFGLSGTSGYDPNGEGFRTGATIGKVTLTAEAALVGSSAFLAPGGTAVFYSGQVGGVPAWQVASGYGATINNTVAGQVTNIMVNTGMRLAYTVQNPYAAYQIQQLGWGVASAGYATVNGLFASRIVYVGNNAAGHWTAIERPILKALGKY
jgi:RHS repeat-associated protein